MALAIRKSSRGSRTWWSVVHAPSGLVLGPIAGASFDRKRDALAAVEALAALGDWSRGADELAADWKMGRRVSAWWAASVRERYPVR